MSKKLEQLKKIRKSDNRDAIGVLYETAKITQDPVLIKEMNKIITKRRKSK